MSTVLLLIAIMSDIMRSQVVLEVPIGRGTSCIGESGSLSAWGLSDKQITYDLYKLYDPSGVLLPESGMYANKSLRMSICGYMTPEETSCGQNNERWCFEEVRMDETCIAGIANWEEDTKTGSMIEYTAMFSNSEISTQSRVGVRISVLDYGQYNITCLNKHSIVNYFIHCAPDTNWTHLSFAQNRSRCDWNVTLRSQYGCFDIVDWSPGGSGSSLTSLSVGSVLLIIFVVILLTYCILGCAYNSFYHGRVGMDAVPNREKWSYLGRYTRAGCEVSRDMLCCSGSSGPYQEL